MPNRWACDVVGPARRAVRPCKRKSGDRSIPLISGSGLSGASPHQISRVLDVPNRYACQVMGPARRAVRPCKRKSGDRSIPSISGSGLSGASPYQINHQLPTPNPSTMPLRVSLQARAGLVLSGWLSCCWLWRLCRRSRGLILLEYLATKEPVHLMFCEDRLAKPIHR